MALKVVQPDTLVHVMAGRVRLEQVLINLIRNALDAMQENAGHPRELEIALSCSEQTVKLTISDTGCGLSDEVKRQLFEPFYSTKPSGVGMGLGLAISLNIIAELKGSLSAVSREQGGAQFIVELPACD